MSMAPVCSSRNAISATPLAIRPAATANGASSRVMYALRNDPTNLPARGTRANAQGENPLVDGSGVQEQERDFRHSLGHKTRGYGKGASRRVM